MLHSLTYSLIRCLKDVAMLTDVVWIYDGIELTGRTKPFSTVEQMQDDFIPIAAGRDDFQDIYRFQVGLYANSISERSKLTEAIKSQLRKSKIPFYNTSNPTPALSGFFVCDVTAVTPMSQDDVSNQTNKHRVYFDVEVTVYRSGSNDLNFTQ